jgi:predicted O-linked N-acetylglucosamine transferase (SPINDLY family)
MPEQSIEQLLETAVTHHDAGRWTEAEAIYQQILARDPEDADVVQLLALVNYQLGRKEAARDLFEQSAKLNPLAPDCHYHLGILYAAAGEHERAVESFKKAIDLKVDFGDAHRHLCLSLQHLGRWREAVTAQRRSLLMRPDSFEEYFLLGNALRGAGELEEAVSLYRQVLKLQPNSFVAAFQLGITLGQLDRIDESIAAFRSANAMRWGHVPAYKHLAASLQETGQLDEALVYYEQAMASEETDADLHSNRLFLLHFFSQYDPASLLQEHLEWNQKHARAVGENIAAHANDRSPERKLRIGYVSADFRQHRVGLFIEPLIARHDRDQFEVICFSNSNTEDEVTARIRDQADAWHKIAGLTDAKVVELIRDQKIDLLVDLSAHMAGNRLLVFARKPAPVQVTYLGYPGTTGLSTIDYRLSDPFLDPAGTDQWYAEKTIRLPRTYACWRWSGKDEPVSALPALSKGYITFGSLNQFNKVTPQVLQTWGLLMSQLPESRLILRCPAGETAQRAREALMDYGVRPDRVELVGRLRWVQYVQLYNRLDIALDPFPFPGQMTSLDSLWMGVPLVTLSGKTAVSRGGASILQNLELRELIAQDVKQYVEIAVQLSNDLPRLSSMRASLRDRLSKSPLMDEALLARDVEAAYRQMWRTWCGEKN